MAIQTRILEAGYDSDAVDAGLNYVCIEIYDDDYTPEYVGDEGESKVVKFDFQTEDVRVGSIRKGLIYLLSTIQFTYEGATKDQLTLPALNYSTCYKDSSGNTTRLVEYYSY